MNEWEWGLLEDKAPAGTLVIAGVEVKPGHRVRLHPGKRGDMLDIALAGKTARFLPDDDFGAVFLIGPFEPACDIHGVADHRVV